jgi:hypothetical protein
MRYLFQVSRVFLSIHGNFHLRAEYSILLACDILVVLKTSCQLVSLWITIAITVPDSMELVALLPYTIFSLFHALTFTRTTIIPQFLPPGPPATAGGPPQAHPVAKKLQVWVKCKRPLWRGQRVLRFDNASFFPPSQLRHRDEGSGIHRTFDNGPNLLRCYHLPKLVALSHLLRPLFTPAILPIRFHQGRHRSR